MIVLETGELILFSLNLQREKEKASGMKSSSIQTKSIPTVKIATSGSNQTVKSAEGVETMVLREAGPSSTVLFKTAIIRDDAPTVRVIDAMQVGSRELATDTVLVKDGDSTPSRSSSVRSDPDPNSSVNVRASLEASNELFGVKIAKTMISRSMGACFAPCVVRGLISSPLSVQTPLTLRNSSAWADKPIRPS